MRRAKRRHHRLLHDVSRVAREIEHRDEGRHEEGTAGTQVWSSRVAGVGLVAAHAEGHWGQIHQTIIKPFISLLRHVAAASDN